MSGCVLTAIAFARRIAALRGPLCVAVLAVVALAALPIGGRAAGQEIRRPADPHQGRPPRLDAGTAASLREPIVLNDDAGWCWFQDERALVVGDRLIAGTVAAGRRDAARTGAVEASGLELVTRRITRFQLSATAVEKPGSYDDHDAPAFVVRGDGRLLVAWAGHGFDNRILSRVSTQPGDPSAWSDERVFVPSPASRVTYANLHRLTAERGRVYDFFRGLDDRFKPSVAWSDDDGEIWQPGGVVIDVPARFRHRPYVRYASNGSDTVHLVYTEGHPRDFDNSLYHVFYRSGRLHRSDGTAIRSLAEGLRDPVEGTRIFHGDAANVAWSSDVELDRDGRPFVAYSVQKDSAGLPPGEGGVDHRYRLARWTGRAWQDSELAFAGTRLYAREDDYTGGVALVPGDRSTAFVSTNADPATGAPLVSAADGKRHWEIFRGTSRGGRWTWQPLTRDSSLDNIRPVVPKVVRATPPKVVGAAPAVAPRTSSHEPILLWLRGSYRAYTDYDLELVALLP